ncbi:MAG: VWA domain-containing protein [Myxococcales bacterium]|nr:VWA domain-containing protein [Myxococcales bacterium]MCB9642883.1 VWA domain-containing protein [Myxococcales bacterium]
MRFQTARSSRVWGSFLRVLGLAAILLTPVAVGCNSYPLQSLPNNTYIIPDDVGSQSASKGVDILFVIDNSGSMAEEQVKLRNNFKNFIERLTNADVTDFQLGIITTDMDETFNPTGWGRLVQADPNTPKIVSSSLTASQITEAFTKNANVGTLGSNFERHLEAVQTALSPSSAGGFADTDNKGFLREGALLAIIFVTDEDDCSHKKKLDETKTPDTCFIPPTIELTDEQGNPLIGSDGKPEKGQMDKLVPVADFLTFLKTLNREVIVSGLIGDPFVNKPGSQSPIDPQGGCTQDSECGSGGGKCAYLTPGPITRKCGGCKSTDANAAPGFRIFDFISNSSTGDPNERWFPICGDDNGFREALLRFAGAIIDRLKNIILSKKPENPDNLVVRIERNGTFINPPIPKAPIEGDCDANGACPGENRECSVGKCYGDGWVYIAPTAGSNQHSIRLSGTAKTELKGGDKIHVSYVAKPGN